MHSGLISPSFRLDSFPQIPVKSLNRFSSILCRVLLLIWPPSERNAKSLLESVKPVVACFKLVCFVFSITSLDRQFHFLFEPKLWTLHPLARRSLNSTTTRAAAKGYFSLFSFNWSSTNFRLCLPALTFPLFPLCLFSSTSFLNLALFLSHLITSDLLIPLSLATI